MRITTLNDGWTLDVGPVDPRYPRPQLKRPPPIPAEVPGSVHLDLIRAGIIGDPKLEMFEIGAQWVDERDWAYRLAFLWNGSDYRQKILRFECLDTVCSILVNGEEVATTDNFFLPLEVDVSSRLRVGRNELELRFASAVKVGDERRRAWFAEHGLATETVMFDERAFVRKPGYMSGWDWGPRLVSCGIAGDVSLIECNDRIAYLGVTVEPQDGGWFHIRADAHATGAVEYAFRPATEDTQVETTAPGEWRVKGPLWWPSGMGDQPLHHVTAANSEHQITKHIGLRTIELVRNPDEYGESFEFLVNGKRLWARGANWIPNDSFPGAIGRVDDQIRKYAGLNFNMLRVWGGGLYESEAFYDACDQHGILVWQDFPFACMYYPDDEPWQTAVQKEAEHHVRRLRHRPSLALWCGNNENLAMWHQKWGSPGVVTDRYCGEHLYDLILPQVVLANDSQTPYIASSPIGCPPDESIPLGPERHANMDGWGDSHYWDVWHGRGDWVHYTESKARFSSEFGFASSCSAGQWEYCLSPEQLQQAFVGGTLDHHDKSGKVWTMADPADPPRPSQAVWHHERTGKTWETFSGFVELHYPRSANLMDWIYYSQLNQRDALRCGIEHYRRSDFCRGALIWQANDCWPVMSWAVEDYRRNLKPAGVELERLYADVMASVDYRVGDRKLTVWAANDGREDYAGPLRMQIIDTVAAKLLSEETVGIELTADSRRIIRSLDVAAYDPTATAVCVTLADHDRWILLAEPKDMRFGPLTIQAQSGRGPYRVTGFVADFILEKDCLTSSSIAGTEHSKCVPITGLDVELPFEPGLTRARSLAGYHEIIPA